MKWADNELIAAHGLTKAEARVRASRRVGCFYCGGIYPPAEIKEWTRDGCALCPKCGIDSVLPADAGFPITPEFLNAMCCRWFRRYYETASPAAPLDTDTPVNEVYLWLDDRLAPWDRDRFGYVWVRTYKEAVKALDKGDVVFADLDHDLGKTGPRCATGGHVVNYIEEHDLWPKLGVRVHSGNSVGKQDMEVAIKRHYGRLFERPGGRP